MLFNSIDFAIFLPIVFLLYWFVVNKNLKHQNILILVASYVFYGWWDWRFLSLILFSTIVDYSIGISLSKQENQTKRKILLWTSILVNVGFLGFFKYYNFFLDNFVTAYSFFGHPMSASSLNIILPVGISFYTFQTLSYTIDVYNRKLEPTKDFVVFAAFVSFFPQLVAGPIERAKHLLPQFYVKRTFEYSKAIDGLRQILWGLFKKIVIADNCAKFVSLIFDNSTEYSGSTLVLGLVLFTFQVYCDFSGYSDIAIGTSRLFGFNLMQNFNFPYFSRDFAEFWRRWHISLSTWFRDYLYIPLGGSRGGVGMKIRNTFVIFIVSGFWHGANWTFIAWGALNAIYFLPIFLSKKHKDTSGVVAQGKIFPTLGELWGMIQVFSLTAFSLIFFRSKDMSHAWQYMSNIFSSSLFSIPHFPGMKQALTTIILLIIFNIVEWFGRENQYAIEKIGFSWKPSMRYALYSTIIIVILWFGGKEQSFIYFQF